MVHRRAPALLEIELSQGRHRDTAIEVMLEFGATSPSPYTGIGLQQMTGVASRVDARATAFAHRDRQYDFLIVSQWEDPADADGNVAWTRRCFEAMTPYLKEGVEDHSAEK
ncbi:hypothetical protein [Pseudarthrobacter sulfonivorans]|nr:hypothetical protein [Pseudarthrobacter sulfonivorans]